MRLTSHRMFSVLSVLVVLAMLFSACAAPVAAPAAPAAEETAAAAEETAAGGEAAAPAASDWWRTAAEAAGCVDATIHGNSESTPPSRYAAENLGAAFTEATGINVEFETTSWDEMFNKPVKDLQSGTGIYDFIYIEQDHVYGYLANDWLVNLTQMLADNPDLVAPDFSFDKFTTFIDNFKDADGNIYGVPM